MIGIVAREVPDVSTIGQARLIERAADELNAEPATCALLCPTVDAIRETETSGAHRIASPAARASRPLPLPVPPQPSPASRT